MAASSPMAGRRRRAWVAVGAGAALAIGVGLAVSVSADQAEPELHGVDAVWEALRAGVDEAHAVEACGISVSADPPAWFLEEVPCADLAIVYADEEWTLVRADAACAPQLMLERLRASLAGAGWISMESGCEGLSSFVKEEGRCSWLMIESAKTDEGTSAVLHILHD